MKGIIQPALGGVFVRSVLRPFSETDMASGEVRLGKFVGPTCQVSHVVCRTKPAQVGEEKRR